MDRLELDHLVVAARTLDEGIAWCEAVFGLRPSAGGRHGSMGTYNRVLAVGSAVFDRAYLEVIAVDPAAAAPPRPRWFDLDRSALQAALAAGPALVHWVARCGDIDSTHATLLDAGIDVGELRGASRDTPQGRLAWRITIRADGGPPLQGAAPALIEWAAAHPTDALGPSGVTLVEFGVAGVPEALAARFQPAIRHTASGDVPIQAVLDGPRGRVTLRALGAVA